ncbi:hypothetical protein [Lentzea jiangxiensis]|uniref:hypothetical protein n=1 Tax=Lentzea jiangxiensis TaxID=641025 RepID=UPI001C40A2E2|nr:hypothetical protein [Lentzea jiangxiensis]
MTARASVANPVAQAVPTSFSARRRDSGANRWARSDEGVAHPSEDLHGDAVALWLGLHGLAHQRAVVRKMPGPDDIGDRLITALAHLR